MIMPSPARRQRALQGLLWAAGEWWPLVIVGVLVGLLYGCGGGAVTIPETIRVPVPVSCIDAPVPAPPLVTDAELLAMDDYRLTLSLALDRMVRRVYEARLEAALAGCWQPNKDGT